MGIQNASPPAKPLMLVVQIPCFNEEATLAGVIASIPRMIEGIGKVHVLVIDDGSTDATSRIAEQAGADKVVRLHRNRGLANAFRAGIHESLRLGADIIVNIDGDHQYKGEEIPALLAPILAGEADITIGDRQVQTLPHYGRKKRLLHRIGCRVIQYLTHEYPADPISGFRALTAMAAIRIMIFSTFSYTIEMVMQANYRGLDIKYIPITTHAPTRPSRLFSSSFGFILNSGVAIFTMIVLYRPFAFFLALSTLLGVIGLCPVIRFLTFYAEGHGDGHIQSLILGGVLIIVSFITLLLGTLGRMISANRLLQELTLENMYRSRMPGQ